VTTWITHLRLAETLLENLHGLDPISLDPIQFAIGSIAPDSGIPDEKWEKFNPPAETTHFLMKEGLRYRSNDLAFFQRYLGPEKRTGMSKEAYSFLLGYFFHLVTDNLHNEKIGMPTVERWALQLGTDPRFILEVKADWYGLDFIYLRDHPESLFWHTFLGCECRASFLDFLPAEAVQQRVAYIQQYYQRKDDEIQALFQRPYQYLPQAEADRFVDETAENLMSIYRLLVVEQVEPGEFISALEMLSGEAPQKDKE
jgi:hypothetical protein